MSSHYSIFHFRREYFPFLMTSFCDLNVFLVSLVAKIGGGKELEKRWNDGYNFEEKKSEESWSMFNVVEFSDSPLGMVSISVRHQCMRSLQHIDIGHSETAKQNGIDLYKQFVFLFARFLLPRVVCILFHHQATPWIWEEAKHILSSTISSLVFAA